MPDYKPQLYTQFQLITYEVPTESSSSPGKEFQAKFKVQQDENKNAYLPVPKLKDNDARIRLKRLTGVVDFARQNVQKNSIHPKTLKIFLAPEFYVRPQKAGLARSYSGATALDIFNALRAMFAHKFFEHWLFVPGTIVWHTTAQDVMKTAPIFLRSPAMLRTTTGNVIRNTAVIVKGGNAKAPFNITHKLYYSDADDIDNKKLWPGYEGRPYLKGFLEMLPERKSSLMTIDHRNLGIDIDHVTINDLSGRPRFLLDHNQYQPLPELI